MKHGKTAVYTILKNEINYIEKWLSYAEPFDYKVLLDTGSTDGSWELLQELNLKDSNLLIEQKVFSPWRFNVARNYNLSMIPDDVIWCLSPDLDEYFSRNTHDAMEQLISDIPSVTNIACDRLDIYSKVVRVGPPKLLSTNKIHRKTDYHWVQPIYEHLVWKHADNKENEVYAEDIYLIHDQDYKKQSRPDQYLSMLLQEYNDNPTNTWCLWFLVVHYYKQRDLINYIPTACDFLRYHNKLDDKYRELVQDLKNLYLYERTLTTQQKELIFSVIKNKV